METDSNFFKVFNSQQEVNEYLQRPNNEWDEEKGKYDFEQCNFKCEVKFKHIIRKFEDIANFKNATFEQEVSFEGIVFEKIADFNGCRFLKDVNFKDTVFEDESNFCSFRGNVIFRNAKFNSHTWFWNHFNGYADFSYSTFKEAVEFNNAEFESNVYFHDATFEKNAFFEETEFKGKVYAWKMVFEKDVSFRWSNFRKKLNISEVSAKSGIIDLHGVNFEGNAYFYDSQIAKLDLKKCVIEKGVYFLDSKIHKSNRETFRIIKHEFLKQNNRIEALKYHFYEMKSFFAELWYEIFHNRFSFSTIRKIGDLFLLFINFISNGFGLWWFLGIIFLLGTTLLMFKLYLSNITSTECINFWHYYPQFLLPTHSFEFIKNVKLSHCAYIIDFFGRVISSFGIYQTVQAFRKFGRF